MPNIEPDPYALARVLTRMREHEGWSLMDIQKRSGKDEHGEPLVKKAQAGNLVNGPLKRAPNHKTQIGLANAFGLPPATIQRLVGKATGQPVGEPEPEAFSDIKDRLREMSEDQQRVAAALVDTYYRNLGTSQAG